MKMERRTFRILSFALYVKERNKQSADRVPPKPK